MLTNSIFIFLIAIFLGAAAGYLGSFMVIKRMSLVGDALTHVALPGMAIALLLNYSPIIGAFVALGISILGIWFLEEHSKIYPEALFGIFFTTSLAVGILLIPQTDILEALFGDIGKITFFEGVLTVIFSLFVIILIRLIGNKLILGIISQDLASSLGISIDKINLIYLVLIGIITALGIKFVGTLLMGGLVIIPAASAKNVSKSIKNYQAMSILLGVLSCSLGIIIAKIYNLPSGPAVVLTSVFFFLLTYLLKFFSLANQLNE